jgi:acetate kinase
VLILALNAGSSSLKYQLIDATPAGERVVKRGLVERVTDHDAAVAEVLKQLRDASAARVDAVGHRIVHGGARLTAPAILDDAVVSELTALTELAPLHNAPGVSVVRACRRQFGAGVPMVAVFDTAFHATLPEIAYRYAIPADLAEKHAIRRYGFHGISYAYVVARYAELSGRAVEDVTMIALHLGNGCSATAIRGGRSVDTSMGFTPLEGLVMGTRAGDLDPAVVGVLAEREGVDAREVERWLNERSGLLGLSGRSRDMRDLLAHAADDPRARLAVDVFCYHARKYVGAYLAVLGRADALVFTGGIGEHAAPVRARICEGLAWAGITLDAAANDDAHGDARIAGRGSAVDAWVIATDEERMIARETRARVEAAHG